MALVDNGGIALQNLVGGANPRIVPGAGGLFAILEQDRSTLHDDFALWLGDVQARLGRVSSPVAAARILAVGTWNAGTRTLTARRIAILMR